MTPETTGTFSRPLNGKGGDLKGSRSRPRCTGELFTDALSGFGAILSYAHTESSITIQDPPGNNFITATASATSRCRACRRRVERHGVLRKRRLLGARRTRARSKYIGEVTNFANDRALKYVKGDQITDAQIGYEFGGTGAFEGLSLLFQVNNLTNEPYIAYAVTETRQQDFQEYGTAVPARHQLPALTPQAPITALPSAAREGMMRGPFF